MIINNQSDEILPKILFDESNLYYMFAGWSSERNLKSVILNNNY